MESNLSKLHNIFKKTFEKRIYYVPITKEHRYVYSLITHEEIGTPVYTASRWKNQDTKLAPLLSHCLHSGCHKLCVD